MRFKPFKELKMKAGEMSQSSACHSDVKTCLYLLSQCQQDGNRKIPKLSDQLDRHRGCRGLERRLSTEERLLLFQKTGSGEQLPVIPALEDLAPSSGLFGHLHVCAHTYNIKTVIRTHGHVHTHIPHTLINRNKLNYRLSTLTSLLFHPTVGKGGGLLNKNTRMGYSSLLERLFVINKASGSRPGIAIKL